MSRAVVNFVLDCCLLLWFLSILFTSAVLRFVFPAPTSAAGWTLWGHGYDAWANLQFAQVAILALAVLLHIMLHWSWVCGVVLTRFARLKERQTRLDDGVQTLWGVGTLILVVNILGVLIGAAYLMIQGPGNS